MEEMREETWKAILLGGFKSVPYRNRRLLSMLVVGAVAVYFLTGIYAVQPQELGAVSYTHLRAHET